MSEAAISSSSPTVPQWVIVARHFVGVIAVVVAAHLALYLRTSDPQLFLLSVKVGSVLGMAGGLAALWALFFTSRSAGKYLMNAARVAWVLAALVAIGEWSNVARPKPEINAAQKAGVRERRVDEVRRTYPRYSGMSDEQVLNAMANDYPEIPLKQIAADMEIEIKAQK